VSGHDELRETVDAIRRERYPQLSADLIDRILEIEAAHIEDRGPAPRLVENAVDEFIAQNGDQDR